MIQELFYESKCRRSIFMQNINNHSKEDLMDLSLHILRKNDRSLEEIQVLLKTVQDLGFFSEIVQDHGHSVLFKLLRRMTLQSNKKNDVIFERGDRGTCFYVILRGQVSVYIPNAEPKKKIHDFMKIKSMSVIARKLRTYIKLFIRLIKVNTLKCGDSFGERALINEALRLATVSCDSDCELAVLQKSDYKEMLQEVEQRKISFRIAQLQENAAFKQMSIRLLNILLFAFQQKSFTYRNLVIEQSKSCKDDIYLIISGEFVLLQDNRQLAILQTGSIFGDWEAFQNLAIREYSVSCNSEKGEVLQIQLSVLQERLAAGNEMHLLDQLREQCHKNYSYRRKYLPKNKPKMMRLSTSENDQEKSDIERISSIIHKKILIMEHKNINWQHRESLYDIPTLETKPLEVKPRSRSFTGSRRSTLQRVLFNSRISKRNQDEILCRTQVLS